MTREESIEVIEYARAFNEQNTRLMRALDVAIKDLQESEERSKGCPSCNGGFGDNTIEFKKMRYTNCPYCGRPLKGAAND